MAQRPTCQPPRGSTSLDYTHVRAGTLSGRKFVVRSYAWRLIRRLPHHLPRGPRRRPFLPATPASSPSPLLSCWSLRTPSGWDSGLVSWPCVYITTPITSDLFLSPPPYSSSRFSGLIRSLSGPVPLEENRPARRKGLERKVGHGRSSSSPSPSSCYAQMLAWCCVWVTRCLVWCSFVARVTVWTGLRVCGSPREINSGWQRFVVFS
jgi:hypothetical protein